MCGFDGGRRGNYFRRESANKTKVKPRVKKLKNGEIADKDEVT